MENPPSPGTEEEAEPLKGIGNPGESKDVTVSNGSSNGYSNPRGATLTMMQTDDAQQSPVYHDDDEKNGICKIQMERLLNGNPEQNGAHESEQRTARGYKRFWCTLMINVCMAVIVITVSVLPVFLSVTTPQNTTDSNGTAAGEDREPTIHIWQSDDPGTNTSSGPNPGINTTSGPTSAKCPRPAEECPSDWKRLKRHCYHLSEKMMNWTASEDFCKKHGAALVVITNHTENDLKQLKPNGDFWIGLKRENNTWKWVDGTDYNDEVAGYNDDSPLNCAYLDRIIGALDCSTLRQFICSKTVCNVRLETERPEVAPQTRL